MKRRLRVLPEAEAELQSAALWYEEKRRGLGVELIAVVDSAFQSVLENPEAHLQKSIATSGPGFRYPNWLWRYSAAAAMHFPELRPIRPSASLRTC